MLEEPDSRHVSISSQPLLHVRTDGHVPYQVLGRLKCGFQR